MTLSCIYVNLNLYWLLNSLISSGYFMHVLAQYKTLIQHNMKFQQFEVNQTSMYYAFLQHCKETKEIKIPV